MKACSLSEDLVLPYDMFITKIVKFFNVNLQRKTDSKKLKSFDTYNWASLYQIQFVCKKDGLWGRKSFVPSSKVVVSSDKGYLEEENENSDVEREDTQNENAVEIPLNNRA